MQSVLKSIWKSIDIIMAVILTCMIVLVFANVVLRYGFSSGLRPSVELSRLGLVWVVMLGAAVVLREVNISLSRNFQNDYFQKQCPY